MKLVNDKDPKTQNLSPTAPELSCAIESISEGGLPSKDSLEQLKSNLLELQNLQQRMSFLMKEIRYQLKA